jgi:hypothetical protein
VFFDYVSFDFPFPFSGLLSLRETHASTWLTDHFFVRLLVCLFGDDRVKPSSPFVDPQQSEKRKMDIKIKFYLHHS